MPCSWLPPSFHNVEYAEIASIDFMTPTLKRKKGETEVVSNATSNENESSSIQCPSAEELDSFYRTLASNGKHAILSLVPNYCESYKPLQIKGTLPEPLECLFNIENMALPFNMLLEKCEKIYDEYELARDLVKNVELYTKDQSRSKFWFQQRAGRITASRLKVAVCTDITQPAKSLVKSICYPETTKFYSKATCYGCEHEQIAYDAYKKKAISEHLNFSLSKSGLVIDPNYPFLGASPDGTIKCACCKPGVLEIKCPYSCQSESFLRKASESQFFLHDLGGLLFLDVYHSYYFQVQAQIKICSASYSDFVVWQEQDLFVQRIYLDEPFITYAFMKANDLIKVGILPELVGKWFSKQQNVSIPPSICYDVTTPVELDDESNQLWCYCRKGEFGKMIFCENNNCSIQWFHTSCLKIKRVPKGKWFCPSCHRIKKTKKTKK